MGAVQKLSGDAEAVPALAPLLRDPDPAVRMAVVKALGECPIDSVWEALTSALSCPHADVREAVGTVLGRMAAERAVPVLLPLLRDPVAAVRLQAARALQGAGWTATTPAEQVLKAVALGNYGEAARLGGAAVEPLAAALRDTQTPNRRGVVDALREIADVRVVKALSAAVKDADSSVRVAAIEALAPMRDAGTTEPLLLALKDRDERVRQSAAAALGRRGDAAAVPGLLAVLKDSNWDVRRTAAEGLGRLKAAAAVEPLVALLQDRDNDVRETAVKVLGEIGDPRATEALILALTDGQSAIRQQAGAALQRVDAAWSRSDAARHAVPALRAALKHKDYWVRQSAAEVLARISDVRSAQPQLSEVANPASHRHKVAIDMLLDCLQDYDRDIRLAAVEALGRFGEARTAGAISSLQSDVDPWVRAAAVATAHVLRAGPDSALAPHPVASSN